MNQDISTSPESKASDGSVHVSTRSNATAGALLRSYREAQGLKIDTLAGMLKVPVSKLESLEHNRLYELPDTMFVRALALSVCRLLKADPTPVLVLLPGQDMSRLAPKDERGINFPLKRPSFLPQSKWMTTVNLFTPMRGGAILALFLALALAYLPDLQGLLSSKELPATLELAPGVRSVEPALLTQPSLAVTSAVVSESGGTTHMVVTATSPVMSPVAAPATTKMPASATGAANVR